MYLIDFINNFYIVYIIAVGCIIFNELKSIVKLKKRLFFCIGITLFVLFLDNFMEIKVFTCLLEFSIIFLLVYYMNFGKLIITILFTSLYALTISLSRYILITIYAIMMYDLKVLKILNYKLFLVFCLLLVSILLLVLCFIKRLIRKIFEKKTLSIMKYTRVSIIFAIIVFLSEIVFDNIEIEFHIVYEASVVSINVIFYLAISYACVHKICKDVNTKFKVSLLEKQLDYQKNYYESIINNYDKTKKILHDMNNHMVIIKYLLLNKDYNLLGEYLEKFEAHIPSNKKNYICKNKTINAICLEKLSLCNEKEIKINFDMNIPQGIKIDIVDLCVVFGNLLDNAIEACENISNLKIKKFINVEANVCMNQLNIRILNSKENVINKEKDKFITSKKNKKKHGYGLENVKQAVMNNHGEVKFIDSNNAFEVKIYLLLSE